MTAPADDPTLAELAGAIGQSIPSATDDEMIRAATAVVAVIKERRIRAMLRESDERMEHVASILRGCGLDRVSITLDETSATMRVVAGNAIQIRMDVFGMWKATCDAGLVNLDARLEYPPEELERRLLGETSAQCSQALTRLQSSGRGFGPTRKQADGTRRKLLDQIKSLDAHLAAATAGLLEGENM